METKLKNRAQAAVQLADLLKRQVLERPLVLSIPNGGVEVGCVLADRLKCEDNILLVRKIPSLLNPTYSLGAVSEFGDIRFNDDSYAWEHGVQDFAQEQALAMIDVLLQKRLDFGPYRGIPEIQARDILLVDDSVITGETALEALRFIRMHSPRRVLVATPVITKYALQRLHAEQVDVVTLKVEKYFEAATRVYEEFPEVTDDQVVTWLQRSPTRPASEPAPRVGLDKSCGPLLFVAGAGRSARV